MKKLLLSLLLSLTLGSAFAQNDFIRLDEATTHSNFMAVFRTAMMNQVIACTDTKGQPLMLIMLPANGSQAPAPGTYPITDGSKRAVKKGSGVAKLEFAPGNYVSADNAGTLTITENDSIFTFTAENVSITNSKTKETHKLSFKVALFIEKK
jgi:hypothetical protein